MKIVFVLSMTSLVRHFESVILELARRGHTIRIATPARQTNWLLAPAVAAHPGVSEVTCPGDRSDDWAGAAPLLRLLADYARFFDPAFASADKLRERARAELLAALGDGEVKRLAARCPACDTKIVNDALAALVLAGDAPSRASVRHLLSLIERVIPPPPEYDRFLATERPDVLLVTPLVGLGSGQTDWIKSARSNAIPAGVPVFSWDNLTTKGVIHEQPDRVFVWNDIQKREAVEFHGVAPDRIDVTGAPRFDDFLSLAPKRNREAFCEKYRLRSDRPIVTYLCSSDFVAGEEVSFVSRWLGEIRQEPALSESGVVIRPHPRSESQWSGVDLSAWSNVAVTMPKAMNADRLLYETLHHSAAVVGLNTSAQIEAALLDKPVLTLLAPGLERGQQGTLHFRYLLEEEGGFVKVARDFSEHRRHVADAVAGHYDASATRAFVKRFVRPEGLDRPATPVLADAIERLAPSRRDAGARRWLGPLASVMIR